MILLASSYVGVIRTLIGLFQVGSPAGYASGCALSVLLSPPQIPAGLKGFLGIPEDS